MKFSDRLHQAIRRQKSFICLGCDPQLDTLPQPFLERIARETATTEDAIYRALFEFHRLGLAVTASKIAAIKPNIAFFEQYGLPGLRAFGDLCRLARDHQLPVIVDAKRGDIGSTAQAYSNAFLGATTAFGKPYSAFPADAVTISPFLGFDTLEPFLKDALAFNRGVFVLLKTSNPGSAAIQGVKDGSDHKTISEKIANWANQNRTALLGESGFSGLGVVVGATYPDEARSLRALMPQNLFLIPGMGAQGGSAADALAGFGRSAEGEKGGGIINISRGILGSFSHLGLRDEEVQQEITAKVDRFNSEINSLLA